MKNVFILLLLIIPLFAIADKPKPPCGKGEIDCVGLCGRFIDENADGFCDIGLLSKPTVEPTSKGDVANKAGKPYRLILISALTLALYALSSILKRLNIISKTMQHRLWNIVLLITFLVSGLLGLLLVVQINYQVLGDWYLSFLHLHVEFGIAMAIVSIIHALWHLKYYAKAFGLNKSMPKKLSLLSLLTRKSA